MPFTTCVFDAYGTLFDVKAAARQAADECDFAELQNSWEALAEHWRIKQLQYTWLQSMTGSFADFWEITQNALDWALAITNLEGNLELRQRLLQLYWELAAFVEVPSTLEALKLGSKKIAILSNGSLAMLEAAVRSANIRDLIDEIISVDAVRVFKPDHRVYDLVEQCCGCHKQEVLFVSSNGWDAACATGYGFSAAWVNRADEPIDRLPWTPLTVVRDLSEILPLSDS